MSDLTLKVIVVSTRPGRRGRIVADWFLEFARQQGTFSTVEIVDLAELNLPLFDEPNHPMLRDYTQEHTKQWSKLVDEADAFAIILPEYNHFVPPSIVNAIDYLHHEWKYKAAGFVAYGGMSGGTRSVLALKPLLANLSVMPISESVFLQHFGESISEDGVFVAKESHEKSAELMLSELAKWASALKPLRNEPGV